MIGEEKVTMSVTFKLEKSQVLNFENWFKNEVEVLKSVIVPDTNKLYETDETFKKLVKNVKKAQRERDIYINKFNK